MGAIAGLWLGVVMTGQTKLWRGCAVGSTAASPLTTQSAAGARRPPTDAVGSGWSDRQSNHKSPPRTCTAP